MEEDAVVKAAPVTRLRRRLSVETDETKSPSTPSTPTKKRATRLAAKPQLELIDEHVVTNSPKRVTRKSISRDVAEPEEKPVTPARRSARTKSNTSLVSEADEKPLTPARRNTRIKSNTSIVLETAQSVESPRAVRALARRNSQVGSDTEAPVTPARNRLARKASTSSTDKNAEAAQVEKPSLITEVIAEEPEGKPRKSTSKDTPDTAVTPGRTIRTRKGSTPSIDTQAEAVPSLITEAITEKPERKLKQSTSIDTSNANENEDDSPIRKSPRLSAKKGRKSKSKDANETPNQSQENIEETDNLLPTEELNKEVNTTEATSQHNISMSSANLLKDLDTKLKKKISNKNKSLSDVENTTGSKKLDRTKSWTTLCASPHVESNFYSDNENTKKKLKKLGKMYNDKRLSLTDDSGSGDGPKPTSVELNNIDEKEQGFNTSKKNSTSRNKSASSIFEDTKKVDISNESNKENLLGVAPVVNTSAAELLFNNAPSAHVKSMVFIEDSDSNGGKVVKQGKQINSEDQCVPIVLHQSENEVHYPEKQECNDQNNIFAMNNIDNKVTNESDVEPMDIDETIPDNVSLTVFTVECNKSRKSSQIIPHETEDAGTETFNKSNRNSLVSNSVSQILDKSHSGEQREPIRKTSLCVTLEADNNFKGSSSTQQESSLSYSASEDHKNVDNLDRPAVDQNISMTETKKSRKSSLSVALKPDNQDKSKSQSTSSLYNSTSEVNQKKEIENKDLSKEEHNFSLDKSMKNKKSRKSSMGSKESDNNHADNNNKSKSKSNSFSDKNDPRKSSLSNAQDGDDKFKVNNKSKRKSSLSNSMEHEKTGNESKSTLVLSQINDISTAENSLSKSPRNNNMLSKSINLDEANRDALVNKNLARNYLTSTPVQQKNIEKLAMQMNTSVITPTNESKQVSNTPKTLLKKDAFIVSKSSDDNSSDEDSQETDNEESSHEKSNLFDDQAEDAGEDYESGDSQDSEERGYERENEIVVKGETLTSEEDISNDSDYEKDSFLVSSDEEDSELLSGSGDDLDMSDNELTLSAKSKNKYNERKLKEQKNASREMFEARHGLNESKQKIKSKKSNRSRLDSTLLKSDEDVMPPKKNKRMRLESTMESGQVQSDIEDAKLNKDITIASDNDEIGYKKKKSKCLSESVCHESTINEKEITICNQSTTEKEDPLLHIKIEPKTPIKDLEISRVHVTDDVEQVHVDENMSIMKSNETSDPLQSTALQEENDSEDDESISECEEIANNYDSVLKELNKESKKQIKSINISLNLDKKIRKSKESIVEELNLTLIKVPKKDTSFQAKEKSVKRVFKKLVDSDESSDSIDLQLLFSDESNGSDDKKSDKTNKALEGEAEPSLIPLKKSIAKTDIRKSLVTDYACDEGTLNFFIDTKGDLSYKATTGDDATNESQSNDAPIEIMYASNKKKNNSILTKTPTSEKKKKNELESEEPNSLVTDVSVAKTPASGKKKKLLSQECSNLTTFHNIQGTEKKKKLSISQDDKVTALQKTPVSDKKARKICDSKEEGTKEDMAEQVEIVTNDIMASNAKKRKRKSSANKTMDDIETEGKVFNTSQKLNESVGNKNKKVKVSSSIDDQIEENIPTSGMEEPILEQNDLKMTKKNKHIKNKPPTIENVSEPSTAKSKKRKRDEDEVEKVAKVFKKKSYDKVHVPRLPAGIIDQLEELPRNLPNKKVPEKRMAKIVSTSNFVVEETLKRKNKPSDFLEETVYLNDDDNITVVKKKSNMKKPTVLPFLPTVSTSDTGFTTNFHVHVISQKMEFVAQNNEVPNFKNDYLYNKKIKKLRTYDLYKKQRNTKLTKY